MWETPAAMAHVSLSDRRCVSYVITSYGIWEIWPWSELHYLSALMWFMLRLSVNVSPHESCSGPLLGFTSKSSGAVNVYFGHDGQQYQMQSAAALQWGSCQA